MKIKARKINKKSLVVKTIEVSAMLITAVFVLNVLTFEIVLFRSITENRKVQTYSQILKQYKGDDKITKELMSLLMKISETHEIPNETPIFANIADKSLLPDIYVYRMAEVGDKAVIFPTSKQIVLYRPSSGAVVASGPFDISSLTSKTKNIPAGEVAGVSGDKVATPGSILESEKEVTK